MRTGLEERELEYVLDVKGETSAYARTSSPSQPPKPEGRGRPPGARYREDPSSLKELALAAGKKAAVTVTWREGTRGRMNSRFLALSVRPANIHLRHGAQGRRASWPCAGCSASGPQGSQSRSSTGSRTFPPTPPLKELVRLAKLRWRIEHDYRELKDALGLDHFEGRTYRGWNHHVTLVSVAHAFLTLERRRRPPARAAA